MRLISIWHKRWTGIIFLSTHTTSQDLNQTKTQVLIVITDSAILIVVIFGEEVLGRREQSVNGNLTSNQKVVSLPHCI